MLLCFRILDSHSGGYKESYHLEYNVIQSFRIQPMFQRNMSSAYRHLHARFLLDFFFFNFVGLDKSESNWFVGH
jgi:hypothetical protein